MATHHDDKWKRSNQRVALDTLNASATGKFFLPCVDQCSKTALRSDVGDLLIDIMPISALWFLMIPLLPFYLLYWIWRRTQPQPGWMIDFEKRTLQAVRQKDNGTCQLTNDMGILAHHRYIEITHPTRGPILTLITSPRSTQMEDLHAQEELAKQLADRLKLRWVGCRIELN